MKSQWTVYFNIFNFTTQLYLGKGKVSQVVEVNLLMNLLVVENIKLNFLLIKTAFFSQMTPNSSYNKISTKSSLLVTRTCLST